MLRSGVLPSPVEMHIPDGFLSLGVSLVYSIIEDQYGNIQVESPANEATDRGTCVRLRLPAYEPETGNAAISQNQRS